MVQAREKKGSWFNVAAGARIEATAHTWAGYLHLFPWGPVSTTVPHGNRAQCARSNLVLQVANAIRSTGFVKPRAFSGGSSGRFRV